MTCPINPKPMCTVLAVPVVPVRRVGGFLVSPEERRFLKAISELIGKPLQVQPVPILENGRLVESGAVVNTGASKSSKSRGNKGHKAVTKPLDTEPKPTNPSVRQGDVHFFGLK